MLKFLLSIIMIGLISTSQAHIYQAGLCPSIYSIKSYPLSSAYYDNNDNSYLVFGKLSQYDTYKLWIFTLVNIYASSSTEAITTGNDLLQTIDQRISMIPTRGDDNKYWYCLYKTRNNQYGIAFMFDKYNTQKINNSEVLTNVHINTDMISSTINKL